MLHAHRRKQRRGHQPRILILAYILLSTRPGGKRDGSAHSTRQTHDDGDGRRWCRSRGAGPLLGFKGRAGKEEEQQQAARGLGGCGSDGRWPGGRRRRREEEAAGAS